ncbi:MAG: methyltransferase domain-containing protein [Lamprobacter sp.]|uniref:class I SAM-dependent methyltransferase n=1 Tax=Lamprobacter sp. TaxID=3100796 RepID=UPI002B258A1F|nr:methyltransferase domain-containing protein [Lamprobacter sp.]MEA3638324.1 methyltransferase domain-containing protein [Lamprobacter sp.]
MNHDTEAGKAEPEQVSERKATCGAANEQGMAQALAAAAVELFGYGQILALGQGAERIADQLRHQGLPAQGRHGDLHSLSLADPFQAIVVNGYLEQLSPQALSAAINTLQDRCQRGLLVAIWTHASAINDSANNLSQTRIWWEQYLISAGFRRHPLYYRLNGYHQLEQPGSPILIPLEKRPLRLREDPVAGTKQEEDLLHRDMLLESGRRSDAHCIRYHEATAHIRPGDTVLDVACGLGYGSHILWHHSQALRVIGIDNCASSVAKAQHDYGVEGHVSFRVGDAQALTELADNSVDFIASFETIEHLVDPDAYLDELLRILKPSGRLMLSAPNNWADETGEDPNPYHHHVYTWDRLRQECGARFLLEQGMMQTAGGAQRLHHAPRQWDVIDPAAPLPHDAEWILLLCMKAPTGGESIPYQETAWTLPSDANFNVSAFARDYDNPWLVRAMVAIGMRNVSASNLASMRKAVLETAPRQSVDAGAALCGEVYAALAEDRRSTARYTALRTSIEDYSALQSPTPHQLRWQVSLLYAGGELALAYDDMNTARHFFERCANLDVCDYSPLLGNKTLDALFRLSIMALAEQDDARALALLRRSISEAQRLITGSWLNITGDPEHPLPFGLAESAQLLDKGSRAAYLIAAIEKAFNRPALLAREARGFFERCLSYSVDQAPSKASELSLLERISTLEAEKAHLVREVQDLNLNNERLAAEVRAQHANAKKIAEQVMIQSDLAQTLGLRSAELAAELTAIRRNPFRLLRRRGQGQKKA